MTWGSNATFAKIACPWCGGDMIDDRDSGPTTHQLVCPKRGAWHRIFRISKDYRCTWCEGCQPSQQLICAQRAIAIRSWFSRPICLALGFIVGAMVMWVALTRANNVCVTHGSERHCWKVNNDTADPRTMLHDGGSDRVVPRSRSRDRA